MGRMAQLFGLEPNPVALAELTAAAVEYVGVQSPWAQEDTLATLTFSDIFGVLDPAEIVINRKTAMSIPAIAKARNLVATSIGRMPLLAEKNNRVLKTQPSMLVQMQTGVTNFHTLVWIVDHMFFYGVAYLLITERNANGSIKTFRLVPHDKAETKDGILIKAFGKDVKAGDYVPIYAHHEGLLCYAAETIRDTKELEKVAAEVGANPTPNVLLKQKPGTAPLQDKEKRELLAAWAKKRRNRFGSVGFVNGSVDVEQIGQAAENLLVEGRNYAVLQAARMVGVPAYFLDATVGGASLNYTNAASKNRQLIDEALAPYMVAIEQTISMYLPAGQKSEFDTDVFLRGNPIDRVRMYRLANPKAIIWTEEEIRAMENLDPLTRAPGTPEADTTSEES